MKLLNKLQETINRLVELDQFGVLSDSEVNREVIKLIYKHTEGNLLPLILEVDNLNKEKSKEKELLLYQATEQGMHDFSCISKHVLEDINIRQARKYTKVFLEEDNLAYIIYIVKAYFPNGNAEGASNNGRWFFNKFKDMLVKHKDKYLEGGSSYDWACNYNHIDYIKLVLKDAVSE